MPLSPRELRQLLTSRLALRDVRAICFDMEIEYEQLAGDTLSDKIIELLALCRRTGRLDELLQTVRGERPDLAAELADKPGVLSQHTPNADTPTNNHSITQKPPIDNKDYMRCVAFNRERDYKTAIVCFSDLIHRYSVDERVYTGRADAKYYNNDYEGAASDYKEALQINPLFSAAYEGLGDCCYYTGKNEEAIGYYTKAISIKPMPRLYYWRANAYLLLGKSEEAAVDFKRVIRMESKSRAFQWSEDAKKAINNMRSEDP
jgi:tetratricopeptide (TPR) repeat protein